MTHADARADACAAATQGLSTRRGRASALERADLPVPEEAGQVLPRASGAGGSTTFDVHINLEPPGGRDPMVRKPPVGTLVPEDAALAFLLRDPS